MMYIGPGGSPSRMTTSPWRNSLGSSLARRSFKALWRKLREDGELPEEELQVAMAGL